MKRLIPFLFLLAALLLSACAVSPVSSPSGAGPSQSASDPTTSQNAEESSSMTTASPATPSPTASAMQSESSASPKPSLILLPPVETNPPNTTYEPAFPGQTRANGVETVTPYDVTILTRDLASPWSVAALPDGRLVITEKAGTLRLVTTSGEMSRPIGGFPPVDNRSQGGLLDVVPAPDFPDSRMLYVTLAEKTAKGSLTAVTRGRLADDERTVENVEIIWRAMPYYDNSMHFGSRIVFDESGNLFVSTGERSDLDTRPMAQTLDNGYGKVVHITPEGIPVPGNPFVGQAGALPEIYSYGHRNAQGLAIHPVTGALWLNEMGPRGGDELNLILPGRNYGWPVISYGIEYSGQPVPGALTTKEGMEQPVYYWDPVLASSGMAFYTGSIIPEWENSLFVAGLRSQQIARLVLDGERVIGEERLLASEGQRFRDVAAGLDGALYAVTDQGRLYRIGQQAGG